MLFSKSVVVPLRPDFQSTTDSASVISFLTRYLGIGEYATEVPDGQTRPSFTLGFRHATYYLYQAQDEIAAKRTLFHRQSEQFIPQTIKDTLPYFLGAIDDNRIYELERLRDLKRARNRLVKQIQESESLKDDGLKKGYELLAEAVSVGLYKGTLPVTDDGLISNLITINNWKPIDDPEVYDQTTPRYALEKRVQHLNVKKNEVRAKLRIAEEYNGALNGYSSEIREQELRLKSIGIYESISHNDICSVCDRAHDDNSDLDKVFRSSIIALNSKLEGISLSKPRISSYVNKLSMEDRKLADELKKTRDAIIAIRNEEIGQQHEFQLNDSRSRTVGRVSLYLESINFEVDSGSDRVKLEQLKTEIQLLEEQLDASVLKERLEAQISCISENMTKWARELGLEHSENPIRLDPIKLTVVAETPSGRTPLYRIGSGENWVGYHLVTYLALAKWFVEQERPVPGFIFFDQPSQVYFPSDPATTDLSLDSKDDDRLALKRMFKWILRVVQELSPHLQIIIMDHADIDEDWFQEKVVDEKWRGERALIPKHWFD